MNVRKVASLISKGFSRKTIKAIIEKDIGVTSEGAKNRYLKEAAQLLLEDQLTVEELKVLNGARLDDVYERALNENRLGEALKAIDMDNKMAGVYVEKIEHKVDSEFNFKISFGDE